MLNLFFAFSSLLSPTGILSLFIRYNDIFAGKTDSPFFFLEGTKWRVGLINKKIYFLACEPSETFLRFVAQSDYVLGNVCLSLIDFHLGGLVSKMHISVYVLFTEWKCFCFFFSFIRTILDYEYSMHTLNILYSLNVNGLNSAVKRTRVVRIFRP